MILQKLVQDNRVPKDAHRLYTFAIEALNGHPKKEKGYHTLQTSKTEATVIHWDTGVYIKLTKTKAKVNMEAGKMFVLEAPDSGNVSASKVWN